MKIVDIGILRTSTVPQVISEVTKFMDIDIKIPATTPQLIMEVVEICQLWTENLPLTEDKLIDVGLGYKISDTVPLEIR